MDSEEKMPVGRPKGSKDTVPRKKRCDRELIVNPGDNARITIENLNFMALPKIDTSDRKQVEDRIMLYFNTCIEKDIKPGVAGLCLALGISRQTWSMWGLGKSRDYSDIVEQSRLMMESILEQYMLNGKINPVTGIFLLKNNFGYADKSEIVLTPNSNPLGEQRDVEALKQKYLENAYGVSDYDSDITIPETEEFEGGITNE